MVFLFFWCVCVCGGGGFKQKFTPLYFPLLAALYTHTHKHIHTRIHTHTDIYIKHTHRPTHIYTYIHIQGQNLVRVRVVSGHFVEWLAAVEKTVPVSPHPVRTTKRASRVPVPQAVTVRRTPHRKRYRALTRNATLGIRYTFLPFTIKNNISKKCRSLGFT